MSETKSRISFLVVATEWFSKHGGLSTFNREFCTALSSLGHEVHCLVPDASQEEQEAARTAGVNLILPKEPGTLNLTRRLAVDIKPDVIVGHDRITGEQARVQAKDFYPGSLFVCFVHVNPEEIEIFKAQPAKGSRAKKAEDRTDELIGLIDQTDLVIGVGPVLQEWIEDKVKAKASPVPVHRFDPGLFPAEAPQTVPHRIKCLVIGRAEDSELKGLGIAAQAINRLSPALDIRLVVRGAPSETGDDLQKQLCEWMPNCSTPPEVREYTPERAVLLRDLHESSLFLMPSQAEGFGLVGLEAISAGVPTLVSHRSGLAQVLRENKLDELVVDMTVNEQATITVWADKIKTVVGDRQAAFKRALAIRERLKSRLDWSRSAQSLVRTLEVLLQSGRRGSWRHGPLVNAIGLVKRLAGLGFTLEQIVEFATFEADDLRFAFISWLTDSEPFASVTAETRGILLNFPAVSDVDDETLQAELVALPVEQCVAFLQAARVFEVPDAEQLTVNLGSHDDADPELKTLLVELLVEDFATNFQTVYPILEGLDSETLAMILERHFGMERELRNHLIWFLIHKHNPFDDLPGWVVINDVDLRSFTWRFDDGLIVNGECDLEFQQQWGSDSDVEEGFGEVVHSSGKVQFSATVDDSGEFEVEIESRESDAWDGNDQEEPDSEEA